MISEKAELRLGQVSKEQIIKEYGLYVNPSVQSYINEVGQKIVAVSERKGVEYEFVILDTPLVNAFAVPGVVFLTRGILELIDDEAELASVIGHEVGHITGFHAVKLIQKSYGYGFLATFAAVAGTIYAPSLKDSREYAAYYDTLYRGVYVVTAGFLSGYGREFELEADHSGLRYVLLAGYDPDAMTSFFKRMKSLGEENTSGLSVFLRTHPPTEQRIREVKKIMNFSTSKDLKKIGIKSNQTKSNKKFIEILKSTSTEFEDHFERYHEIVKSIPKIESESVGLIKERVYENPSLKIRLEVPPDWKLESSFGKSLVHFSSLDGKAQGELQLVRLQPDAVMIANQSSSFAGVTVSTQSLSSREWAERIEEGMKFKKRMGREVVYPIGPSYVGTYKGIDRVGRPALFKVLYVLLPLSGGVQEGYILSCAAPEETYLDVLLNFEKIMQSLIKNN